VYTRQNPQADADKYQAELAEAHRAFLARLASLGMDVQLGSTSVVVAGPAGTSAVTMPHDFTVVFNGVGVLMPGRLVAEVAQMAGVRAVTHNHERVYLNMNKSIAYTGAPQIWSRLDSAGRALKGEGVTVAVIDTGIDWTHPEFGGFANAPNDKVIHTVSLTGENPIDNFGHGTHVSCIIAGDADYKGTPRGDAQMNGMAPKAKLMGYKVLTAAGSGSATNIILAMEDAAKRGAHVMNLSLGDSYGDPLSPESSAANNAMLAGVIVCIAAGNAGPERSSVGSPGAAHHVITITWTH
jgi:subtilisin family serine protease